MVAKAHRSKPKTPKSQSDQAAEKRTAAKEAKESKRLDKAGDAYMAGDKKKAAKILGKKDKPKKITRQQAEEVLAEAQAYESQVRGWDIKISSIKEEYKEAKASRERVLAKMRLGIAEAHQGRLPFGGALTGTGETKGTAPGMITAHIDMSAPKDERKKLYFQCLPCAHQWTGAPMDAEVERLCPRCGAFSLKQMDPPDPIDTELDGADEIDAADKGDDGIDSEPVKKARRRKKEPATV